MRYISRENAKFEGNIAGLGLGIKEETEVSYLLSPSGLFTTFWGEKEICIDTTFLHELISLMEALFLASPAYWK